MRNSKIFKMLIIGIVGFVCGVIINSNIEKKPVEKYINNYFYAKYVGGGVTVPFNSEYLKEYNDKNNIRSKGDLKGKDEEFVKGLYGEPTYEMNSTVEGLNEKTKVFIYCTKSNTPEEQAPTAIYILLKDNSVLNYKIDEFNGLMYPEMTKEIMEELLKKQ